MSKLIWTRGENFPLNQLADRLRCPRCGGLIGIRLVAQEAELDRQFASRTATDSSIAAATQAIGTTQATLRAAHLRYHLATLIVLTPAQTHRYVELRGYASGEHSGHQHGGHQH